MFWAQQSPFPRVVLVSVINASVDVRTTATSCAQLLSTSSSSSFGPSPVPASEHEQFPGQLAAEPNGDARTYRRRRGILLVVVAIPRLRPTYHLPMDILLLANQANTCHSRDTGLHRRWHVCRIRRSVGSRALDTRDVGELQCCLVVLRLQSELALGVFVAESPY